MGLFMIKFSFFFPFKTILFLVYVSFKKKSKMTIIFYHTGLVIFVHELLATNLTKPLYVVSKLKYRPLVEHLERKKRELTEY